MNKKKYAEVEFSVEGNLALFTTPDSKMGGEKFSYDIPTYEALKGILKSIYWKPTFIWYVDSVRIMNKIVRVPIQFTPIKYKTTINRDLFFCSYLKDVKYQVKAHFEWNPYRVELFKDRIFEKHSNIAHRMLERGGKRPTVLGTTECQAFVKPCVFGDGVGFYDNMGEINYPNVFHGFDWPDESKDTRHVYKRFWSPVMLDGVVNFVRPEDCSKAMLKSMVPKQFGGKI